MFTQAIVRTPAASLSAGLTTAAHLGVCDIELAYQQHEGYIQALRQCGLEVTVLPPLPDYPDACFVEDVALLTAKGAVLTRPGAPSRQGEVAPMRATVEQFYPGSIHQIEAPGTLEAGDVLQVQDHFYIGLSARTNAAGARQLSQILQAWGYTASTVPLREFLHLKTGVSALGPDCLLLTGELVHSPQFADYRQLILSAEEAYAANCLAINGTILMPAGFDSVQKRIEQAGFVTQAVPMSEFRKLDGGLSCLSLRF